jgi:hybrid cluster-associated redox disulfide protein
MCEDESISPNVSVEALLNAYPRAAEVLNAHAMACVGCFLSAFHTVAQAAAIYGLDSDQLVHELHKAYAREQDHSADP